MLNFREWRRRRWLQRHPVPERLWRRITRAIPLLDELDAAELGRLRALATVFLREKVFTSTHGLELDEAMRLRIATLGCLPILNLGLDWYRGWKTVIVYPGEFIRPREHLDGAGLVHRWEEVLSGESWERGPLIVSWADVQASGELEGFNVVIHELAHKLDMLNGPPDGFPPLHRDMDARRWTRVFTGAFEDLTRRVEAGEPTALDAYAVQHPAEFFAVLSEYFFELPETLAAEYPDVYEELRQFYRQDPKGRAGGAGPPRR
jgi:Mlc titration factor MtfA (ptsG expression regulator)